MAQIIKVIFENSINLHIPFTDSTTIRKLIALCAAQYGSQTGFLTSYGTLLNQNSTVANAIQGFPLWEVFYHGPQNNIHATPRDMEYETINLETEQH